MRTVFTRLLGALVLGGLLLSAESAQAGLVFNSLNDINFIDRNAVVKTRDSAVSSVATPSTTLRNGDRFYGIFDATGIISNQPTQMAPITPELTGVFDVTVQYIIAGVNSSSVTVGTVLTDAMLATYTGQALPLFRATNLNSGTLDDGILGSGTSALFGGASFTGLQGVLGSSVLPDGTALALFEGGSPLVLDSTLSQVADIGAASDGTHLGSFGFTSIGAVSDWGAAGNGYWFGSTSFNSGQSSASSFFFYGLEALSGPIATTSGGPIPLYNPEFVDFGFGLIVPAGTSIIHNYGNPDVFTPTSATPIAFDLTGTGNTFVNSAFAGGNSAWPGASSDPAHVYPQPEPGTIVLALLGACGVVPVLRRRKAGSSDLTV